MMNCPKCGKEMYAICTVSHPDPIAHVCNNPSCEEVRERQSKAVSCGEHVMYYSEESGLIRHFKYDGETWVEQYERREQASTTQS